MSDDLWERIESLLPRKERRCRRPGRRPLPDRQMLCGIPFALHAGIQWNHVQKELGFGSGTNCWRRLRDWKESGVCQ
ncbi:transposase [Streptomyces sp. SID14478]|nr:transposase [Streptomyces sp. SID14478]